MRACVHVCAGGVRVRVCVQLLMRVCAHARACTCVRVRVRVVRARVCARVCVHACVRARVCVCVCVSFFA